MWDILIVKITSFSHFPVKARSRSTDFSTFRWSVTPPISKHPNLMGFDFSIQFFVWSLKVYALPLLLFSFYIDSPLTIMYSSLLWAEQKGTLISSPSKLRLNILTSDAISNLQMRKAIKSSKNIFNMLAIDWKNKFKCSF